MLTLAGWKTASVTRKFKCNVLFSLIRLLCFVCGNSPFVAKIQRKFCSKKKKKKKKTVITDGY